MTTRGRGGGSDVDARVRTAAFAFLTEQSALHGDTLPRTLLAQGFVFEGQRVPLLGPQGIFKPPILPDLPLSITTALIVEGKDRPYDDDFGPHGLLVYRYRGRTRSIATNVALRLARQQGVP